MRTFKDATEAADFIANLVLEREVTDWHAAVRRANAWAKNVQLALGRLGFPGVATPQGSVAKNTHLGGSDIDIFIVLPAGTDASLFKIIAVEVATELTREYDGTVIPMTASHPYAVLRFESGDEIDIVPCFDVPATAITSAVDRTPHHTRFMNQNLSDAQKRDVRKLKLFLKGTGLYGADVWTGGFSGYAAEVMVHRHGTFMGVLNAMARGELANPMLDPVDANRNVLASVTFGKMKDFKEAAWDYICEPKLTHFYPYMVEPRLLPHVLVVRAPAPDENSAAEVRSTLQGIVNAVNSERFLIGQNFFLKNGWVYACFSSRSFPNRIERNIPDKEKHPEGHAAFMAKHAGKTDRLIDERSGVMFMTNSVSHAPALLREKLLGLGYVEASLKELGAVCRVATIPSDD